MFKLVLFGPPGAGKGTQAKLLAKTYRIPHISTGVIFRDHIARRTALGIQADQYISEGNFVPDVVTNKIVEDRLSRQDCASGFILDGYPRSVPQAEFLQSISRVMGAIELAVSDEIVIKRLSARRLCSCGSLYNIISNPPKQEGVCDSCKNELYRRDDDAADVIKHRLKTYKKETLPLVEFYKERKKFFRVNGTGEVPEIAKRLRKKLTTLVAHVRG